MALLDLIGQHQDKPLYDVFGGRKRDRVAMIWRLAGATDEIGIPLPSPMAISSRPRGPASASVSMRTS